LLLIRGENDVEKNQMRGRAFYEGREKLPPFWFKQKKFLSQTNVMPSISSDNESDSSDSDFDPENGRIIECIDVLEDHLLDDIMPIDIYLGDDEDEHDDCEEGKGEEDEAGAFFRSIRDHCKSSLPLFIDAINDELEMGEYLLEHTEAHQTYVRLIEDKLENIVREFDYDFAGFVSALRLAIEGEALKNTQKKMMAVELLEIIDSVEKFGSFAEGMKIKAVQKITGSEEWEFGRRF